MENPFNVDWPDLFYNKPDPHCDRVREFARWLRQNREMEINLFHGTGADNPILTKGLLPTTATRRRSMQSGIGFVYLSVFPTSALMFGQMGYPGQKVMVYAVKLKIKELRVDTDQLKNQRMWSGLGVQDTLEHSLIFGHGARVRGKIEPHRITLTDTQ